MASFMYPSSFVLNRANQSSSIRVSNTRGLRLKVSAKRSTFRQREEVPEGEEEEAGIKMSGLRQLISMGLGTISGDITEINLNDPARTVVMELEANNLEDENGEVAKGEYFEEGWVDESSSGGFWGNLFGKKDK
mmetsp:Transcript_39316/g.54617  ORF Transcript_39316/g.54617 Transcript_39316/m.54617 type:complete len:134 (-) Transcript_39316:119-520(-)|eukprot:CAMPEP_0196581380 /NCGR_PEP_ID=MMETSP1081-20130531/33921_1 /TAXON_ID=36882 /ORGANISM="Pyramimonas amylifera, Strain CCMP720" /LENGTH=133 /DNA_ID=CAMNT_0041901593 /DNA_START=106 /DNA_END=507 /DNA_ORIENTATION=-